MWHVQAENAYLNSTVKLVVWTCGLRKRWQLSWQ